MTTVMEVYEFGIVNEKADYEYFLENLLNILSYGEDREFRVTQLGNLYSAEEWLTGSKDVGDCYIVDPKGIFRVPPNTGKEKPATKLCNFYDIDEMHELVDRFRAHRLRVLFMKIDYEGSTEDEVPFGD